MLILYVHTKEIVLGAVKFCYTLCGAFVIIIGADIESGRGIT